MMRFMDSGRRNDRPAESMKSLAQACSMKTDSRASGNSSKERRDNI
jgi:hypothetical protein